MVLFQGEFVLQPAGDWPSQLEVQVRFLMKTSYFPSRLTLNCILRDWSHPDYRFSVIPAVELEEVGLN